MASDCIPIQNQTPAHALQCAADAIKGNLGQLSDQLSTVTIAEWLQIAFGIFIAWGGLCLFAIGTMFLKRIIQRLTFPKSVYTDLELKEARKQRSQYIKLFLWCAAAVFCAGALQPGPMDRSLLYILCAFVVASGLISLLGPNWWLEPSITLRPDQGIDKTPR
jgi:hypothetical protein